MTVLLGASEHPGPVFAGTVETGRENDDGHQDRRPLSNRDRAVLRAVAAGGCQISHADGDGLIVDGLGGVALPTVLQVAGIRISLWP